MHKSCGRFVQNLRETSRTSCACLSTPAYRLSKNQASSRAQTLTYPRLLPQLSAWYSTALLLIIPLFEHNLYPVSTAPTISTTNLKS